MLAGTTSQSVELYQIHILQIPPEIRTLTFFRDGQLLEFLVALLDTGIEIQRALVYELRNHVFFDYIGYHAVILGNTQQTVTRPVISLHILL